MRRVKEVLRLAHELGYSLRQTSRSVRLCSTSVRNYLARAEAAGVRYEDIASKSEAEIEALLFTQPSRRRRGLSRTGRRWPRSCASPR